MDAYTFLNLANDLSWVAVSVFDCDSEQTVYSGLRGADFMDAIEERDLDSYEVESFDIFLDANDALCLELNISMGENDE